MLLFLFGFWLGVMVMWWVGSHELERHLSRLEKLRLHPADPDA